MGILKGISSSDDVKKLSLPEKIALCDEIRKFTIDKVSHTGGHLASNLGVVELTVALHSVFNIPGDKFVWDVGHQSYINKMLTGRQNGFDTLRRFGGMSGFPKTAESEADVFNTGHSSTSISAAVGLATARDLKGEDYSVGAIFGDGALTGGMMYEAMNVAGSMRTPIILILNDNNMSISRNVGSMSKYLVNLRIRPGYYRVKNKIEDGIDYCPVVGKSMKNILRDFKHRVHRFLIPSTTFENFGFEYFGPIDGHDLEKLIEVFELAKTKSNPVFIHIYTKKGKGYEPAERHPESFHGVGPFNKLTGDVSSKKTDYSHEFGASLLKIADNNDKVVAITCAMPDSTGLCNFYKCYPNRFFDVGIAEQHGVTMAAGLAMGGLIPVIPLYSSFLQRAYDQVLHDVCLQNLHVVFPIDRAGLVGADGETHQGMYDIAFLSTMPNMSILSPSNFVELDEMLDYAINVHSGPIAIRYPRGNMECGGHKFEFGKGYLLTDKGIATIYTTGRMIKTAEEVNRLLGGAVKIVVLPTILPLDKQMIIKEATEINCVIEDGTIRGGLGSMIATVFSENDINKHLHLFAFPPEPIVHGTIPELDKKYGVDAETIAEYINSLKEVK